MTNNLLNDDLRLRINKKTRETFIKKSKEATGLDYQVFLREVIEAFNEGRLRIKPTDEQKNRKVGISQLYDDE